MTINRCGRKPLNIVKPSMLPVIAALLMLPHTGCGESSGPQKAVVTGAISFDGKPIERGKIMFYPIDGTPGGVSGGQIRDGNYEATGKGGVPVGKHRVEIFGYRAPKPLPDGEIGAAEEYLPDKYNKTSELTFELPAGSSRVEKNFDLTP